MKNKITQSVSFATKTLIFVATLFFGTVSTKAQQWTTYTTGNSGLVDNDVFTVAIDAQGNKWFGTYDKGVSKFDGTNWTTYNTSNSGLASNGIRAIAIDAQGNEWFGTWNGVSKFDGTNWTTYTTAVGLFDNYILSIAIDKQNNKWFGGRDSTDSGGGVSKFDGTHWTSYTASNSGLVNNYVYVIAIDSECNIWFATNGGVSELSFSDSTYSQVSWDTITHITTSPTDTFVTIHTDTLVNVMSSSIVTTTDSMFIFMHVSTTFIIKDSIVFLRNQCNDSATSTVYADTATSSTTNYDTTTHQSSDTITLVNTGLENIVSLSTVRAYPNPFTSKLTVDVGDEVATIVLTDALGRIIVQTKSAGYTVLQPDVLSGVYFLRVTGKNKSSTTIKVIAE